MNGPSLVRWLVTESLRSLGHNRPVVLASVASIALACVGPWIFVYGWQAFDSWAQKERTRGGVVEVFLTTPLADPALRDTAYSFASASGLVVDSVIDTAEARAQFVAEHGSGYLDELGINPLPASIRLRVPPGIAADSAALSALAARLRDHPGVEEVVVPAKHLAAISRLESWAHRLAWAGALLMGLVVFGVVHNSVRLSLAARESMVDTMRLCGASRWHIELPFAVEGGLHAALGAILAAVVPWFLLLFARRVLGIPLPEEADWALWSFLAVAPFACAVGATSGWWTLHRSLR